MKPLNTKSYILNSSESGQLLLEILVSIGVAAVIIALGAQLFYVSQRANKIAGEKNVGIGLLEETFDATRSATTEKWQNLFDLTKGSTNYYPQASGTKWALTSGSESVTISGIIYTRSFTVQNVCRHDTTRDITGITDSNGSATTCAGSPVNDPSTQKVNVTISWPDADALTASDYVTRWRNKICLQTAWSTVSSSVTTCPDTTYDSQTNITPGTDLQLCSGGC